MTAPAVKRAEAPAIRVQKNEISQLLERALDKNISVEALEKLVALHERVADRNAAQEFHDALARFQASCPPIGRTRAVDYVTSTGARVRYNYAELDHIVAVVGPGLHAEGFSYWWDSADDGKMITTKCTLSHVNGHSRTSSFACPIDTRAKMSEGQQRSSAWTVGRRQSFVSVLGLTTTEPDDDAVSMETITDSQVADLEALITEVKADRKRFLAYLKVPKLSEIRLVEFSAAVSALESKRRKV